MSTQFVKLVTASLLMLTVASLSACGAASHFDPQDGTIPKVGIPADRIIQSPADCVINGSQLTCEEFVTFGTNYYEKNCAECHDPIEMSEVAGANLKQFNRAIEKRPKMQKFSVLTEDERRAIVAALQD